MSLPLIFKRGYAVRPLPRIPDPLKTSTRATTWEIAPGVTFTHRPPPTAPSPFSLTSAPASPLLALRTPPAPAANVPLPPPLHKVPRQPRALTPEQVEEIQALRAADPIGNPASAVARAFGVTPAYVRAIAPLPKADAKEAKELHIVGQGKDTWGPRKRIIREARQRRRDFW